MSVGPTDLKNGFSKPFQDFGSVSRISFLFSLDLKGSILEAFKVGFLIPQGIIFYKSNIITTNTFSSLCRNYITKTVDFPRSRAFNLGTLSNKAVF